MMTNDDKADLRAMVRSYGSARDEWIAECIGCALATVKKYRKAINGAKQ